MLNLKRKLQSILAGFLSTAMVFGGALALAPATYATGAEEETIYYNFHEITSPSELEDSTQYLFLTTQYKEGEAVIDLPNGAGLIETVSLVAADGTTTLSNYEKGRYNKTNFTGDKIDEKYWDGTVTKYSNSQCAPFVGDLDVAAFVKTIIRGSGFDGCDYGAITYQSGYPVSYYAETPDVDYIYGVSSSATEGWLYACFWDFFIDYMLTPYSRLYTFEKQTFTADNIHVCLKPGVTVPETETVMTTDDLVVVIKKDNKTYDVPFFTISSSDNTLGGGDREVTVIVGDITKTLTVEDKAAVSNVATPKYTITAPEAQHGTIELSKAKAKKGGLVLITVTPDEGWVLDTISAYDANGKTVKLTAQQSDENLYTFRMPAAKVFIEAEFAVDAPDFDGFATVSPEDFCYEPTKWAVKKGLIASTDDFDAMEITTRSELVTYLWKLAGCPKATGAVECPFGDLDENSEYYQAVLWAYETGVTAGTSPVTFSPDTKLIRSQTITLIHHFKGSQSLAGAVYTDVDEDDYYFDAVQWASGKGITDGTSDSSFSPESACTNQQLFTFLYRSSVNGDVVAAADK